MQEKQVVTEDNNVDLHVPAPVLDQRGYALKHEPEIHKHNCKQKPSPIVNKLCLPLVLGEDVGFLEFSPLVRQGGFGIDLVQDFNQSLFVFLLGFPGIDVSQNIL